MGVANMAVACSDREIEELINERKPLSRDHVTRLQPSHKISIQGDKGNEFCLILRQNRMFPSNFSIILAYMPKNTNQLFRLRRYNGKSHQHTNTIERKAFYDFHIHTATERYQQIGAREDWYAEPTDRFVDFYTALQCMLSDCGFDVPEDPQLSLL